VLARAGLKQKNRHPAKPQMLFNSWQFVPFIAAVLGLYFVLPFRWQNRMLLAASCLFYGAWDWRFLVLLVISTSIDYVVARRIEASRSESIRRRLLFVSCAANLGILGFFRNQKRVRTI
jgi:alginate O-acetyltransferase complex protein AlgI